MASSYFLRNLPSRADLERLKRIYPELDAGAAEAFMALLKLASDVLDVTDAQLARRGLTQAKLCVLIQLQKEGGPSSPSALAGALGVSRPTITGLLDGLEKEGLARRGGCPGSDRRCLAVALTPKGRRALAAAVPARLRSMSRLMGALSAAERGTLLRLLGRLRGRLGALEAA